MDMQRRRLVKITTREREEREGGAFLVLLVSWWPACSSPVDLFISSLSSLVVVHLHFVNRLCVRLLSLTKYWRALDCFKFHSFSDHFSIMIMTQIVRDI